jgi:hypothetical protein
VAILRSQDLARVRKGYVDDFNTEHDTDINEETMILILDYFEEDKIYEVQFGVHRIFVRQFYLRRF